MNLKATLTPVGNLRAVQSIGGKGGTGSVTWDKVKDKPFETLGDDFVVENGELGLGAVPVGEVEWDNVQNKPFSTIGDGLEVNDGVLSADIDCASCIDNKSIVLDDNGKVSEAVPVWTETIQSESTHVEKTIRRAYHTIVPDYLWQTYSDLSDIIQHNPVDKTHLRYKIDRDFHTETTNLPHMIDSQYQTGR